MEFQGYLRNCRVTVHESTGDGVTVRVASVTGEAIRRLGGAELAGKAVHV